MRSPYCLSLVLGTVLLAASPASAQIADLESSHLAVPQAASLAQVPASLPTRPGETIVVAFTAPIFATADQTLVPLRVAREGTVLTIIAIGGGGWYHVEFQDPQQGLRRGYVQKTYLKIELPDLRPMDLSVRTAQRTEPTTHSTAPAFVASATHPASTVAEGSPRYPQTRQGVWGSFGLGAGFLGCEDCTTRLTGLSGGSSVGGTVTNRFLIGVGTTGWARSEDGEMLTVNTVDVRVRVYPVRTSGFFITAGLGIGTFIVADVFEIGPGAVFGFGWDVRVSRNISLTPFYNGFAMSSSLVDANVAQVGLAITIH